MRLRLCTAVLVAVASAWLVAQTSTAPSPGTASTQRLLASAAKLLVVTTEGWDAVPGTLRRYARVDGRWQQDGDAIPVVVGKSGLGWDRRLATGNEREFSGPIKREGDGKSPAGVFALGKFFGYAPALAGSSRYVPLTAQSECVDDPSSRYYSQVLERSAVGRVDWNSAEQMRRSDELYRWGVIVDYNTANTIPGAGSCIFLHIWRGPGQGTAGCTAMTPEHITALIRWLDDGSRSAIVQLPIAEYKRLRSRWDLP
ncbi:MAG: L,D-transpeptidase family protein [Bacteroidales bacterium]